MVPTNISTWNTSAGHGEQPCDINWKVIDTFCFVVYIMASVASLVGNALIILTILKFQGLKTITNTFIVNMCASDIFVPMSSLLWDVLFVRHPEVLLDRHNLGTALCIFFHFIFMVSAAVSIQSLIIIAVDRFFAIVLPTRARINSTRTRVLLVSITWIIGFTIGLPQAVRTTFYIRDFIGLEAGCYSKGWTQNMQLGFQLSILLLFRVIPLVIITVLYTVMILKLRQQRIPGNPSYAQAHRRRMQNFRRVKMMLTVLVLFFFGWTVMPIFEFISFRMKDNREAMCFFATALNVMIVLPSAHTALNPWVYFAYSNNFRQGFRRLISRSITRSPRVAANGKSDSRGDNLETSLRLESVSNSYTKFESDFSSSTAGNLNHIPVY